MVQIGGNVTDALLLLCQIQGLSRLLAEAASANVELSHATIISNTELIFDLADKAEDLLQ